MADEPKERDSSCGAGCLILLAVMALIVAQAMAEQVWAEEVWGGLALSWPGGGYGFAAAVGVLAPWALASFVAPLTRISSKESRVRSLGWALAALPGLAACWLLSAVILSTFRPQHRSDWGSDCYSQGGPCWVHEQFPFLWAVGVAATVAGAVLLVALLVMYDRGRAGRAAT
ncbi:hypothetical protein GCM10027074_50830 [Streptomyces deserti]